MERGILLLLVIAVCVYLIADSVTGNKKWLDRFISKTIPEWTPPDLNPFN